MSEKRPAAAGAIFVGLTTLDLVHFVDRSPDRNEKVFARDTFVGAGGPATNAALTYSFLGGRAHLISSVGSHAIGSLILSELARYEVGHTDAGASRSGPPLISSVVVSTDNGDRSIVTTPVETTIADAGLVSGLFDRISPDLILVDGHEIELALAAARLAGERGIPVVFDGGRWKPGFAELLEHVDHAVVSEGFRCPDGDSPDRVIEYLHEKGVAYAVITRGQKPIIHSSGEGLQTKKVERVSAIDTLAAGDIFHGAYCHGFYSLKLGFIGTLDYASKVAGRSCQHYGPRTWMKTWSPEV